MTGDDELEDGREQLPVVQSFVLVPSGDQSAYQIVTGLIVLIFDQPAQLRNDTIGCLLGFCVVGRRQGRNQHGHEPATKRGALAFVHAQQLADNGEWERKSKRRHQIDGSIWVAIGQTVEEVLHDALYPWAQTLDPAHREGRGHKPTQSRVIGRIDGEHVPIR